MYLSNIVIKFSILYAALLLGSNIIVNCNKAITSPQLVSGMPKLNAKLNGTSVVTEEGGNENDDAGKEPVNYNCSTKVCPSMMNICCVGYHCDAEYCVRNQASRAKKEFQI